MREDDNFSFDENSADDNGPEFDPEAVELRKQIGEIHKKLTGENTEPVTNNEILQFIRIINYNFLSLTKLLQAILIKSSEIDTTLIGLSLDVSSTNTRLQQFFETNCMLDEIVKGDLSVSGSAPDDKFII